MGKVFDRIDEKLTSFLLQQKVFFVATAPLSGDGHINLSPKGLDTFRILDATTVAYADLPGSGIETTAHLKENGRIVLMFCAFDGAPKIVRLHGRGEVVEPESPDFERLGGQFPDYPGLRSIVRVECSRISDSCGFGVPVMRFEQARNQLCDWAEQQGPEKLRDYQQQHNAASIDGLPGLSPS